VFANRINGVPNAPTGGDSTPEGAPEYKAFEEVVEALDGLEDAGAITLAASKENEDELVIRVREWGRESEEFKKFVKILRLNPKLDRYRMRIGLSNGGGGEIVVDTRPILSAMFYLGQGIRIPEAFQKEGSVYLNVDEKGQLYDWNELLSEIFTIHSSEKRPDRTYAEIEYAGYWFYIDIADIDTRETLTMLSMVLTLKAGGIPRNAPVLTIPVGGGG
jgi:hypothetical protein